MIIIRSPYKKFKTEHEIDVWNFIIFNKDGGYLYLADKITPDSRSLSQFGSSLFLIRVNQKVK